MPEFVERHNEEGEFGRLGSLNVPNGPVETPALFPVMTLIGGPTPRSGGIWRWARKELLSSGRIPGMMFQAMSFTDFGVSPENLQKWRSKPFTEWYDIDSPVFIDSGGFKLMNSDTFGTPPSQGGSSNDWGLYTNPESILALQADFGADIIATLDYPIPPDLDPAEQQDRMHRSIDSAVRCLELLENPEQLRPHVESDGADGGRDVIADLQDGTYDPGVYVAIHGHDYETINWYVAQFLDRIEDEDVGRSFEGFAIGSLVPLRNKLDVLVDIVQGAKDAIPNHRRDELGLHVFGVAGKLAPLLALLGVDTFDCSSHIQAAKYRKYIIPGEWRNVEIEDLWHDEEFDEFPCDIDACSLCGEGSGIDLEKMYNRLYEHESYTRVSDEEEAAGKRNKSFYYAKLAQHNYALFERELRRTREAIERDELLEHVIELARAHKPVKKGLKQAQARDTELEAALNQADATDLLAGPGIKSFQSKLTTYQNGSNTTDTVRSVSLEYGPNDFDIVEQGYDPPSTPILLFIPCSKEKPYSRSRTQQVVLEELRGRLDRIHKVTVSGLYGPVPGSHEQEQPVLEYDYVLTSEEHDQMELVTDRLVRYLGAYGERFETVLGYAASKQYREVIAESFNRAGRGQLYPTDLEARQLTEHFRNDNLSELREAVDTALNIDQQRLDTQY